MLPRACNVKLNLHWIVAAHRGKANQAAHDGGATRSIRAFCGAGFQGSRRKRFRGAKNDR